MKYLIALVALVALAVGAADAGCRLGRARFVRGRRAVVVQQAVAVVNPVVVNRTATLVVPHARTQVLLTDTVGVSAFLIGGYGSVVSASAAYGGTEPPSPAAKAEAPKVDLSPVLEALKKIESRLDKLEAAPEPVPAPKADPPAKK